MRKIFIIIFLLFTLFILGCGDTNISKRVYGKSLNKEVAIRSFQDTTIYTPKVYDKKLPIVLFLPGWNSKDHNSYNSLLSFIASQGYGVIYSKCEAEKSANRFTQRFLATIESEDIFDKTKIGIVGHSSGGGLSFKVMSEFLKKGFGEEGRFIFSSSSWFAFEMSGEDFQNLGVETKVVMQEFSGDFTTDPRIPLTIFSKLKVPEEKNRDYQIYKGGHNYITGNKHYDEMQAILKPLDALMDNVFNKNKHAYNEALNVETNETIELKESSSYPYNCNGNSADIALISLINEYGIDYCKIDILR
jgi:hypothetical protein